jgi:sec-independent protein translocase protein TatA
MPNLGMTELMVILVIALLLFGGKKLPELAKGLGEGIKNFKNSIKDDPAPPPSNTTAQQTAGQQPKQ